MYIYIYVCMNVCKYIYIYSICITGISPSADFVASPVVSGPAFGTRGLRPASVRLASFFSASSLIRFSMSLELSPVHGGHGRHILW